MRLLLPVFILSSLYASYYTFYNSPSSNLLTLSYRLRILNQNLKEDPNKDGQDIEKLGLIFINNIINETIEERRNNISDSCYSSLNNALNDPNQLYLIKLFRDSAKNKNDLGSYLDCFTINYQFNNTWTDSIRDNLTYIIIHIDQKLNGYNITDVRYETGNFLFGGCVIKGCNTTEYKILFDGLNNKSDLFPKVTLDEIDVYDWGDNINTYYSLSFFLQLIPAYLIFFVLLWSCFPYIPVYIFKCFFTKNEDVNNKFQDNLTTDYNESAIPEIFKILNQDNEKKIEDDEKSDSKIYKKFNEESLILNSKISVISYDQIKLNRLKNCFELIENAEEILNTNVSLHNMTINNDSGLSIVKGLRGLNIIWVILGCVFKILYNSPIKIFCNVAFKKLVMSFTYTFILFGLRFSPRIFFSLSGFCLIYKMLCYLDNEVEKLENESRKNTFIDSESMVEGKSLLKSHKKSDLTKEIEETSTYTIIESENQTNKQNFNEVIRNKKTSVKTLSREKIDPECEPTLKNLSNTFSNNLFISYPSHSTFAKNLNYSSLRYFLFLQIYKYLMFILAVVTFKFTYYNFIGALYSPGPLWVYLKEVILNKFTYIKMFSMIFLLSGFSETLHYGYDLFWCAQNEIFFFIIFSLLIFVFYKKNWRFDLFIIFSFIILIFIKLGLFLAMFYTAEQKFLPSLSFNSNKYFYIQKNPFYNMPSFLIGLFFGSVNYCIQKSITKENFKDINKKFLNIPCKFRSFFRKYEFTKVILFSLIFGILFILTCLGYMIIYNFLFYPKDEFMNDFYNNLWVNIFFLLDIEFGILFMYLILIPLFLMGENFIISFFSHDYWNFLSRPYFMFILLLNTVTLYVFYQSESRVKLELFNIIFFSLLVMMIIMIISASCYISFEVPLKKLNKLILESIREKSEKKCKEEGSINKSKNK
jgi:hypothetical protein